MLATGRRHSSLLAACLRLFLAYQPHATHTGSRCNLGLNATNLFSGTVHRFQAPHAAALSHGAPAAIRLAVQLARGTRRLYTYSPQSHASKIRRPLTGAAHRRRDAQRPCDATNGCNGARGRRSQGNVTTMITRAQTSPIHISIALWRSGSAQGS